MDYHGSSAGSSSSQYALVAMIAYPSVRCLLRGVIVPGPLIPSIGDALHLCWSYEDEEPYTEGFEVYYLPDQTKPQRRHLIGYTDALLDLRVVPYASRESVLAFLYTLHDDMIDKVTEAAAVSGD